MAYKGGGKVQKVMVQPIVSFSMAAKATSMVTWQQAY